MKQLISYYSVPQYEEDIKKTGMDLPEFLKAYGLDGIELLVYRSEPYLQSFSKWTVGTHLRFWNSWLPLWYQDEETLLHLFKNKENIEKYYGGLKRATWILQMQRNIKAAALENPKYMVMHIAEANPEEIFSYQFKYSDEKVLKTAARAFNKLVTTIPENVQFLFENLWWPGLRLTEPKLVEEFFSRIERKNVGLVLDTGHLMNTNPNLKTEEEGIDYVCQVLKNMGPLAKLIKVVHLNCSISGTYLRHAGNKVPNDISLASCLQRVCKIDQHKPFTNPKVQNILEMIEPQYVVHELAHNDSLDYEKQLRKQLHTLGL